MTSQEFQNLDYEQQFSLIKEAVFIGTREGCNYTATLYQLGGFYIETLKHKKYQYIYQVEAFDDTDRLDPYLTKLSPLTSSLL